MKHTFVARSVGSLLLLLAMSCGKPRPAGDTPTNETDVPIVSNRAQTDPFFSAIIRLSTPPLIVSARKVDGKLQIDAEAKQKLLAEQEQFLAELKGLPGEVKVLYRYRLTLNAIAILAPIELKDRFNHLNGVVDVSEDVSFDPPKPESVSTSAVGSGLSEVNSVNFIGAGRARKELNLTGKGVRIGVVDTGIDYTHKMFGGAGTPEAYSSNDSSIIEAGSFPTAKVVGGIDLVGRDYNSGSPDINLRVPKPDLDPLDEGGHGSHVAGTIAGHGDGVQTYDGVAPDAVLYAIKVFGSGSTGSGPILAAFEYAADPDQDLDPADRLDAVNLSLGSNFGTRFATYYVEAIKNLATAGTVTVCSAGNSGPTPFIVGSPGTSDEALSIAATIDNSPWNWKFDAAKFAYEGNPNLLVKLFDAAFTKPSVQTAGLTGNLVYLGTAAVLDDAQKAAVQGQVALIDRGEISFFDKVKRSVEAGAIGVVVVNNAATEPFTMGGSDGTTFEIPAIMIARDVGTALKAELAAGRPASVTFWSGQQVTFPDRIDAITNFSSRGPRSIDALLKPEISAPGELIVSAAMGSGSEGVQFSGTSMAAPHATGAVALLRQAYPKSSVQEIRSRMMQTSTPAHQLSGAAAPVSLQGAGRIRIFSAATTPVLVNPSSISLGVLTGSAPVSKTVTLSLKNVSKTVQSARFSWAPKAGLTITGPTTASLAADRITEVTFNLTIDLNGSTDPVTELDNVINVDLDGAGRLVVPLLAVVKRGSSVQLASLSRTPQGLLDLALSNTGVRTGTALPFNLLGTAKKSRNTAKLGPCTLASVGYRVVAGTDSAGQPQSFVQFGVSLPAPLSTWNTCQISVLFDTNNDGVPEQELAGAGEAGLWPTPPPADRFASFLVDAAKMRELQLAWEHPQPDAGEPLPDSAAVLDVQPFYRFPFSKVGVVSADLSKIARTQNGLVRVKVGALPYYQGSVRDYFLGDDGDGEWFVLDLDKAPFRGLPAAMTLAPGETAQLTTTNFAPGNALLVYLPENDATIGTSLLVPTTGSPSYLP